MELLTIFIKRSFFPVYRQDFEWAKQSILIVSPFVTQKRIIELLQIIREPLNRKVKVTVITRLAEDFADKLKVTFEESIRTMKNVGDNTDL